MITGASEGIGLELARIMAAEGWNLVLVARRGELLANLASNLIQRYGIRCAAISADLSKTREIDEIIAKLTERGVTLDALINNAGFGYYGMFAGQDWEPLERMIAVNITALTNLTRLIVPGMVERGAGMVMNVDSTASFQAVPSSAVYAATKAYVLSFSEALATELSGTGVTVTALCPGATATGFQRVAGNEHVPKDFRGILDAETVARLGYEAMLKGRRVVVTGLINRILVQGVRLVPRRLATDMAFRVMRKRGKW